MLAAEKGQTEVCVKLAELGADLNLSDRVRETCSDCISVYRCVTAMLILFFELGRKDGLDLGCL